jgi:hypothetical protein
MFSFGGGLPLHFFGSASYISHHTLCSRSLAPLPSHVHGRRAVASGGHDGWWSASRRGWSLKRVRFPLFCLSLSLFPRTISSRWLWPETVVQCGGRYIPLFCGFCLPAVSFFFCVRQSQIQLCNGYLYRILGGGGELVLGRAATQWIFFLFFCSLGTFHFSKVKERVRCRGTPFVSRACRAV